MYARLTALVAVLALALAACTGGGGGGGDDPTGRASPDAAATGGDGELVAMLASFDLAVGQDQRLLVGLQGPDRRLVGGGQVDVRVAHLGEDEATDQQVTLSEPSTAEFLPVPGKEPEVDDTPAFIEGSGAGVYETTVDLDQPGFWGLHVTATVDGQERVATARFEVGEQHRVPAVGDEAPATDNPTVDSGDVEPIALDSRAQDGGDVPDPHLHDTTIADAREDGRPTVVIVSTPVYCVSQFCGPITEAVADLADQYGDRAEFVHLEVWQEYQEQVLNPAAEEWIFDPETGGNEPWVFLVDADGIIAARWDNVLDAGELTTMLEQL